jgi:putative ABC transport system substrate-binding protein
MRRRELLVLLGSVAVVGSAAVLSPHFWQRAQDDQRRSNVYRVGLLSAAAPIADNSPFGAPLMRGLSRRGYELGRNLVFERRGAEGHIERLGALLDELVASKVDVIVTFGYPAAVAAKRGTKLPIVVFAIDPVRTGLAESLTHPGGNVTGISDVSAEVTAKRMELLKQMAPRLQRVAILWNANDLGMTLRYRALEAGAQALGVRVQPLGVREPQDFEEAFAAMTRELPDAVLMVSDVLTNLNSRRVYEFAATHRLPTIYEFDFLVRDGGLMSYGPDLDESLDRAAALLDHILKGASAADLPFEQPTRFRFVLNVTTAKALGLTIPPSLLARADEVIE